MTTSPNRRVIPRPWLAKREAADYYGQGSSSTTVNTIDIDDEVNLVWDKPKWNVSWGKLSSCFCVRQRQPSKMAKTLEDYEPSLYDTSFQIHSKQQMGLGRQVDVALFANARNPGQLGHSLRSWSFGSRGTGTNNGSMSSFSLSDSMSTVSESSSSHLEDAAPARPPGLHSHVRSSSFAVDPSQDLLGSYFLPVAQSQVPLLASCNVGSVHNNNPSNSNNNIINGNNNHNNHNAMSTGKPPMISQRHTSLPPRVSAPSIGTPPRVSKNVGVRARCDTGDYSKSSAVTNTSRHRRMNQHFSFCDDSMGDICSKNQHRRVNSFYASDEQSSTGVPLSMILCPVLRRPEVGNGQREFSLGQIQVLSVLASRPGLKTLADAHPNVHIHVGVIDNVLTDDGLVLPGMGDAGDRLFGTPTVKHNCRDII